MRTLLRNKSLYFLMAAMVISTVGCSAKTSSSDMETVTEVETGTETEAESTGETGTEEETSSGNGTSANNTETVQETETETEEETFEDETEEEALEESAEEEETEEEEEAETEESESEEESTTSGKTSSAKETTSEEETEEEITVQSVSAVVSGTHYVGETLSGSDIEVTVKMSDGTVLTNPDGWSAQPLTLNSTSNLLTVSYEGASVTITVNAEEVPTTTTVLVAEATTTAATTAETTTTPETTTEEDHEGMVLIDGVWYELSENYGQEVEYICDNGDWSYEFAMALFDAQNELREELGLDPFIWDDQMYEVAKICSKVTTEADSLDHSLTEPYRTTERTTADGQIITVNYSENLSGASTPRPGDDLTSIATSYLWRISQSEGHYAQIYDTANKYAAIGCYNDHGNMVISYLFYTGDEPWMS